MSDNDRPEIRVNMAFLTTFCSVESATNEDMPVGAEGTIAVGGSPGLMHVSLHAPDGTALIATIEIAGMMPLAAAFNEAFIQAHMSAQRPPDATVN